MTQAKKWKKQKRKEREKRQRWEILIDYLDSNDEVQTLGRSIHRSQLMNFVKNAENVVSAADLSGFTYFGVALYLSQRAKTTPRPQETMDRLINKTLGGLSVYGKSSLLEKSHEVLRPCHVRYVYDWPSEILECLPHTIDADDVVGIRCLGEVDFEDLITGRVEKQQVTFRLVQKRGDPNKYNVDENQKWMLRKWAYEMSEIICGRQSDYSTPEYDHPEFMSKVRKHIEQWADITGLTLHQVLRHEQLVEGLCRASLEALTKEGMEHYLPTILPDSKGRQNWFEVEKFVVNFRDSHPEKPEMVFGTAENLAV